jgi:hypothetical protein
MYCPCVIEDLPQLRVLCHTPNIAFDNSTTITNHPMQRAIIHDHKRDVARSFGYHALFENTALSKV